MYEFKGRHYVASLYDVKEITNIDKLRTIFESALRESGANILGKNEHLFSDGGFTCVWLLAESHCSIHTYVNQKNIFVDFFTCGTKSSIKKFNDFILCNLELNRSKSRRMFRN